MNNTRLVWLLMVASLTIASATHAQEAAKIPRIGFVSETADASVASANLDAFRQGLRELGYVEGKNILLEYRYMGGITERSPIIVADLEQLKVDVLVSTVLSALRAASSQPRQSRSSW